MPCTSEQIFRSGGTGPVDQFPQFSDFPGKHVQVDVDEQSTLYTPVSRFSVQNWNGYPTFLTGPEFLF